MRGSVVVCVLALLFVAHVHCQQQGTTNLTAMNVLGIDMVLVDTPGWLTHIQRSMIDREVLIFGQSTLRPVQLHDEINGFVVLPATSNYDVTLQDLSTVYVNGTQQTFALANFDIDQAVLFQFSVFGPYVPLARLGVGQSQYIQKSNQGGVNWGGIMMAAIRTDPSNPGDVLTYTAGWILTNASSVSFSVMRIHYNATVQGLTQPFVFDPVADVGLLYTNFFSTFSPDYKPWIHLLQNYTIGGVNVTLVIVADPNSRTVYSGYFGAGGWVPQSSTPINMANFVMVSTTLGYSANQLFVGLAQSGFNVSGSIMRFDFSNPGNVATTTITLPQGTNNPKALVLDERNNTMYIGLNGGSKILRLNLASNTVTGYQTLPEWLHRIWAGTDMPRHAYFITYEEHAKVFRVNKDDFCPTECPFLGYCQHGACVCGFNYTLTSSFTCEPSCAVNPPNQGSGSSSKGGEIALGILFMFATIAAAAGWFMWWRGRRGSYQTV